MSNFNLRPIPVEIRYKLLQKQKAFARQSITAASSANKPIELGDDFLNFHNRATWAHMIGLTVITGDDQKQRIAIIGAGELNQEPGANEPLDLMKSSFDSIYSNTLYRPISGIKSISTRYEGTLKSRRECTVNFTVFSLEDLDRLSPYFFRVGSEVLVEFGWNVGTDTASSMFNTSLGHKIIKIYNEVGVTGLSNPSITNVLQNNTAEKYEKEILQHNGDYEYVLGQISNFDYSLRSDGGFDCVVKVQTIGMSLLDTKVDREYSPSTLSAVGKENKPMFTSPDDASDEFYIMMHNLPEIIYGSLILHQSKSIPSDDGDDGNETKKAPPITNTGKKMTSFTIPDYKDYLQILIGKPLAVGASRRTGGGIDATDAAWGLMGGQVDGMPGVSGTDIADALVESVRGENQKFVLALMAETLVHGWGFWTDFNPLLAVFQEALLEQDYKLPAYGPDGLHGSELLVATIEFLEKEGHKIFQEFFINLKNYAAGLDTFSQDDEGRDSRKKFEKQRIMLQIITTRGSSEVDIPDQFVRLSSRDDGITTYGRHYGDQYHLLSKKFLMEGGDKYGFGKGKYGITNNAGVFIASKGRRSYSEDKVKATAVERYQIASDVQSWPKITLATTKKEKVKDKGPETKPIESKFYTNKIKPKRAKKSKVAPVPIQVESTDENENNITIFTSYRQGDTTQIFTGFNWGKSMTEFYRLSEKYTDETYRDNLFAPTPTKIMRLKEDEREDARKAAGVAFEASKSDEFLEFVDPDGTVPPKIWIRWGWFEDNILTRYLGYTPAPDGSTGGFPISLFKSIEPKIDEDTGKVLLGYESNKIGLPGPLLTTNVNQIIIPDRVETLEYTKLGEDNEANHNFYASLGTFIKEELGTRIPNVEKEGGGNEGYKVGYIRNLYVEASTLQEAFLNIGTLKEGIDRFISIMYNNFGRIHQLEVQQGRDDNMVGIVDTNLVYKESIWNKPNPFTTLSDEANKINVFEFPAWEKESIVKSQDLKVTIPNEMALTALYAGNEQIRNLGIYDESRGSVEAQKLSKFLRLDYNTKDVAEKSISDRFKELESINILYKKLTISGDGKDEVGNHKYTELDMALLFNNELQRSLSSNSLTSRGVGMGDAESITLKSIALTNTNIVEMKGMFVNGYYTDMGTLEEKDPFNRKRLMEYELQYHQSTAVQNNYPTINRLLDLSLTIDGTAGIFPGNSYISKYLPKAWQKRVDGDADNQYPVIFQATDVAHEISSDGWSTTLTGMPRMNPKSFPYKFETRDISDESPLFPPSTTAISKYYNFFNLNSTFVTFSLDNILYGINIPIKHTGNLDDIGVSTAFRELNQVIGLRSILGNESRTASNYADFSEVYKALTGQYTIPGKDVLQTEANGDTSKLVKSGFFDQLGFKTRTPYTIPERSMSGLEVLIFLQMSMIISGLSYYAFHITRNQRGMSIDKAFYNNMLADTNFITKRPKALQLLGDKLSILISQKENNEDEREAASRKYFTSVDHGIRMNTKEKHTNYFWSSISPFMWVKKKYFDIKRGDASDVPTGYRLIGPAKFTPPGLRNLQTGGRGMNFYPYNSVVHIHESIFKTILKNEFGVDSWRAFDKKIGEAIGFPVVGEPGSVLEAETILAQTVDSEELFKYALECEYLIKTPS